MINYLKKCQKKNTTRSFYSNLEWNLKMLRSFSQKHVLWCVIKSLILSAISSHPIYRFSTYRINFVYEYMTLMKLSIYYIHNKLRNEEKLERRITNSKVHKWWIRFWFKFTEFINFSIKFPLCLFPIICSISINWNFLGIIK